MGAHDHAMGTEPSTDAAAGQVSTAAAEVYEQFFVPALFRQLAEPMLDAVAAATATACSTSERAPVWSGARR